MPKTKKLKSEKKHLKTTAKLQQKLGKHTHVADRNHGRRIESDPVITQLACKISMINVAMFVFGIVYVIVDEYVLPRDSDVEEFYYGISGSANITLYLAYGIIGN